MTADHQVEFTRAAVTIRSSLRSGHRSPAPATGSAGGAHSRGEPPQAPLETPGQVGVDSRLAFRVAAGRVGAQLVG